MKTIAQILKPCKKGDILVAGRRRWKVIEGLSDNRDRVVIALPVNKATTFELWSCGVESVAVIPGLKVVKK